MKNTVETFRNAKGKQKLSMLTAYDFTIAGLIDKAGINGILVGDSLGMVMMGYENTLQVTMEDMIHHCKAVKNGITNALLVCDMPFMSFQTGVHDAVANAGRLVKEGGASAVKLEGGREFSEVIQAITTASIPVMAHLGLMPQSFNSMGGYKVQGKTLEAAQKLIDDARIVEKCGAFALLLECVPWQLAARITSILDIPVIGIGSGSHCDGQILVWQDMLGMNSGHTPKFVKKFAETGNEMYKAFQQYDEAVKKSDFPLQEHSYTMDCDLPDSF